MESEMMEPPPARVLMNPTRKPEKMSSLFVSGAVHRQGVGQKLVRRYENEIRRLGSEVIYLMATVYAIPFYLRMGYKRTTGVRRMNCFDGVGLEYQPMKKVL